MNPLGDIYSSFATSKRYTCLANLQYMLQLLKKGLEGDDDIEAAGLK